MNQFEPLQNHCIFRTRQAFTSHARVAEELADHYLDWHGSKVDTRFCKMNTPRLSLYALRYGSEVSILPDVYEDFSLIHFAHHGQIDVTADKYSQALETGRVLISSPKENIKLRWSEDSEQLILRLPHELTKSVAADLGRPELHKALVETPGKVLATSQSTLWQSQLQGFVNLEKGQRDHFQLAPWLAHVEQSLAMFLLLQYAAGERIDKKDTPTLRNIFRRKRRDALYEFALANLTMPVTLCEMANAAALSCRQLNEICQAEFKAPPMAWLRSLRLDAARKAIQSVPDGPLSAIAMEYGFFHLGRFSEQYRRQFGETPSETLKSATNG